MIIILVCMFAVAAEPETIPLDEIWAYEMPETQDVTELEPKVPVGDPSHEESYLKSATTQIVKHLSIYVPKKEDTAGPAFIVEGTGKDALRNALKRLKAKELIEQPFPKDTELSLVFYSYVTGWRPQITAIEKSPNEVVVKYQFAPGKPSLASPSFAIIPLGKLPEGTIEVKIEELPPVDAEGNPVAPKQDAKRFVCDSFSFDVK